MLASLLVMNIHSQTVKSLLLSRFVLLSILWQHLKCCTRSQTSYCYSSVNIYSSICNCMNSSDAVSPGTMMGALIEDVVISVSMGANPASARSPAVFTNRCLRSLQRHLQSAGRPSEETQDLTCHPAHAAAHHLSSQRCAGHSLNALTQLRTTPPHDTTARTGVK